MRNLMKPDYRTRKWRYIRKQQREYERLKLKNTFLAWAVLGLLAGLILGKTLWDIKHPKKVAPGASSAVIEVSAAEFKFCYDPIACIRDVGEQMGKTNQEVMTMIRIANCESRMNPNALGVNRNGTVDRGLLQINSIHKSLSNADAFDFEKNIRFAWTMHTKQGFRPWVCWRKVQ